MDHLGPKRLILKSVYFKNTVALSAEIKTKSAVVVLKIITILKELRIAQLCSKNGQALVTIFLLAFSSLNLF